MKNAYTVQELIDDASFHRFLKIPDSKDGLRWQAWIINHPDQEKVVEEAREILSDLRFRKQNLSTKEIDDVWHQVQNQTTDQEDNLSQPTYNVFYWAASVALILVSGLTYWFSSDSVQIHKTGYGETIELVLEDSSRVQLNANSSISYHPDEMTGPKREVYLEGEAFFDISHQMRNEDHVPFLVKTADGVVEVLGTRFNVQSRHRTTQVVLESGSVRFETTQNQVATLIPGDMLEYTKPTNSLKLTKVNPQQFTAWRNQKLYFDETPLKDLALILEDNYGKEVIFRDSTLLKKELSGEISAEKLDNILLAVSRVFSVKVTQQQDTIIFESQAR